MVGIDLQRHNLFCVKSRTQVHLTGFLVAGGEDKCVPIPFRNGTRIDGLVEEVHTHGGGNLFLSMRVDAVVSVQVELRTDEMLVVRGDVLKDKTIDFHLLCQHRRILGGVDFWLEIIADANAPFQGDEFVPMFHGFILTSLDEFVDGVICETGSIEPLCVHTDRHIGDSQVLIIFVLTVHINDLAQDANCMPQIITRLGCTLHRHTNDDVGTHFTGDVGRVVVPQTTIHQHFVANAYRGESRRNRHRCAHSLWQNT